MQLVIHRGAHQVGGSCVELSFQDKTILVDIGLPLDCNLSDGYDAHLPQPLFDNIKEGKKQIDAVILSHAHLDHYGLAGMLPREITVYCGAASAEIVALSNLLGRSENQSFEFQPFQSQQKFEIGPFAITPLLMDHSAFDAHGFLIEAGGKSVFYTGDFRGHGRKGKLLNRLIQNPPKVDVLMMEGTLVGERSNEKTISESDLEDEFVQVINQTPGIVLVTTSSQNIDRLVTLFRSAKRTGRMFIIDFYTAEILDRLEPFARLPQASWPRIRVCYPQALARFFEKLGLKDLLVKHRANGIRWTRIAEIENRVVMLIRAGFMGDLKRFLTLKDATWVYSLWPGYFERSLPLRRLKDYLGKKGARYEYLHTSGHANLADQKRLVEAMAPDMVIPIHTFHSDQFKQHFPKVHIVKDGEAIQL
jgi:ribonuclease J